MGERFKEPPVVSLNLSEKLLKPERETDGLEGDDLKEAIKEWFLSNFEDPAENTPFESAEGGYQYIWGGPYDAREQIEGYFGDTIPEKIIDEVVQELERDADEWAPNGNRIYDEDPPDDEALSDDYAILQSSLDELETTLDAVETIPGAIGGNNPPEDIGVPPYTDEVKAELKAAIEVLRQPEMVLQLSSKEDAQEAAQKIKTRADKLGEFLVKHGNLAADAFSAQLGKNAATAVVAGTTLAAVAIWPHLYNKLIAVYEAVQALFAF
jgi:hypothetical protein